MLEQTRKLARIFKHDDGRPFEHTDTQLLIIACILGRIYPRIQLVLPTQYGKSDSVAQGVLTRAANQPERWAIVAPTKAKAEIIMGYIIKHIFDDDFFQSQLIFDEPMERLRQHRSKEHLTFVRGGEIMVLSADSKNRRRTKETLMGFGAPNVVLDESGLVEDDLYATVKRMLGGHKDNFLLEIGNPFTRGHFLRTWLSDRYETIWIDYKIALAEGRYTEDFIEEMRDEAFFDVLYECFFPAQDEVRSDGYRRLLIDATITNAYIDAEPPLPTKHDDQGNEIIVGGRPLVDDKPILGVDVAAGGENQTVFVLRYPKANFAKVLEKNHDDDLDNQADRIMAYRKQYSIGDYRVVIDDGGVGHGLGDILKNKHDILFKRVLAGEAPHKEVEQRGATLSTSQKHDRSRYANNRAMLSWKGRKWLKQGGQLLRDEGFDELGEIYYKQNPSDKLQIEPKEKMRERGVASPDTADALFLTFTDTSSIVEEDDIYVD